MRWVRRLAWLAAAIVVAVLLWTNGASLEHQLFPVGVGSRAPNFHAATLDSVPRMKSLADYRGQVVLLNVWATWCVPCRVEMPSIEKLYEDYGRKGLKVVAVSVDEPGSESEIREFASTFGLKFEILYDPRNAITADYDLQGYPETIVIGRDGTIRKKQMAASDWSSADNRALIGQLLAEKTD